MANEKEWQQDISTTVDAHTAELSDHENRLNQAELNIADHEKRINDIETTTDVGQITLRVNAIEQKNTEQDGRLDNIDAKNNAQDETLATYSERLDNIDSLDVEQNSKIKAIQDKDTEQDTKIADLEKKSKIHDESINTINSINSEQNVRLTTLEEKDTEQDQTIQNLSDSLTAKDNELKQSIDTNATNILANSGEISAIKEKLIDSSLTEKGLVQLTNAIDASEDKATTPKAVKDYVDTTNNQTITLIGRARFEDIGIAGQKGFGQSACEDETRVKELGFRALNGTVDPDSDNTYGVYEHEYAGLCCYIPKFWVRIGSENAPQYEIYKNNSVEIAKGDTFDTEEEALAQGYFLHRAFIDGGEIKKGFFLQKYNARVSTQNTSDGNNYPTSYITNSNFAGYMSHTMIDKAKMLGQNWNVSTCFMLAAHQIVTLALAQKAKWSTWCKWFKSSQSYQYPTAGLSSSNEGLYTHNGMPNGIAGLVYIWQLGLGITTAGLSATQGQAIVKSNDIYLLKKEKSFTELTSGFGGESDAWGTETSLLNMYDKYTSPLTLTISRNVRWGNGEYDVLTNGYNADSLNVDELGRALCGVLPKNDNAVSANGTNQMANSEIAQTPTAQNLALLFGGEVLSGAGNQPCFSRALNYFRVEHNNAYGFRCACYA